MCGRLDPLSGSDLSQKPDQRSDLVGVEPADQFRVVGAHHAADLGQPVDGGRAEVDLVVAAVGDAAAALDEATVLELVEKLDDAARHGADSGSKRMLTQPGLSGDLPENADVGRGQAERLQALGKAARDMGAKLREQQGRTGGSSHLDILP